MRSYRKFGETAEAAQLTETEPGTLATPIASVVHGPARRFQRSACLNRVQHQQTKIADHDTSADPLTIGTCLEQTIARQIAEHRDLRMGTEAV
jgi:hypothetical protein